jgi:hypothetical protein
MYSLITAFYSYAAERRGMNPQRFKINADGETRTRMA